MEEKKNYWTKHALEEKKQLQSQKIKVGKHYRHPKLSELTFEKKEVTLQEKSREERRQEFLESRKLRKEKLDSLPFSAYHNKLINSTYSKLVNSLKKSALEAAHEERIKQIMARKAVLAATKAFGYDKHRPNMLIINRCNNEGKIYNFMTLPSSLSLESLRKIGTNMFNSLQNNIKDLFDIEIWEKESFMKHMKGELATYRYQIGRKAA